MTPIPPCTLSLREMPSACEPIKDAARRSRGSSVVALLDSLSAAGLCLPLSECSIPPLAASKTGSIPGFRRTHHLHYDFPGCNVAQYDSGDYVKVEFAADTPGLPGEWMWVRVLRCDEERQLLFGTLDNEPVVNPEDLRLGQELAISYNQIREHKKPWEFRKN